MLVKTDKIGFLKDTDSGAIINTDEDSYRRFLAVRESTRKTNDICNRINAVENDLRDIKDLLLKIVDRNN